MGVQSALRLGLGLLLLPSYYCAQPTACPLEQVQHTEAESSSSLLQRTDKLQRLHSPPTAEVSAAPGRPIAEQESHAIFLDHDGMPTARAPPSITEISTVSEMTGTSLLSSEPHERPITFVTIGDAFFSTNLAKSPMWMYRKSLPHEWIILENPKNEGVSTLYARAQAEARHPLLVFLHPDVTLPGGWYEQFIAKLKVIETMDPNWGVLGTAGVPAYYSGSSAEWASEWGGQNAAPIASSITDFANSYKTGVDNLEVQSLDEHLLVIRKDSVFFDPNLPGFDLYGTDIVLCAREAGMKAYLLNLVLFHKKNGVDGQPFPMKDWWSKLQAPAFGERVLVTQKYLSDKWCSSGLLPTHGCAFSVWCPM